MMHGLEQFHQAENTIGCDHPKYQSTPRSEVKQSPFNASLIHDPRPFLEYVHAMNVTIHELGSSRCRKEVADLLQEPWLPGSNIALDVASSSLIF